MLAWADKPPHEEADMEDHPAGLWNKLQMRPSTLWICCHSAVPVRARQVTESNWSINVVNRSALIPGIAI